MMYSCDRVKSGSFFGTTVIQEIFAGEDWLFDLKSFAQDCKQFVEILKFYSQEFEKSVLSSLKKKPDITSRFDRRITFLNDLYIICRDGGDVSFLTTLLNNPEVKKYLPALFLRKSKIGDLSTIFQKLVPIVKLINEKWDSVVSGLEQYSQLKISKKVSKLPCSLYFINLTQVFVYVKGEFLGKGSFKQYSSFIPLGGTAVLARAKGRPYDQQLHEAYTREEWDKKVKKSLEQGVIISIELRQKNVPFIPWILPIQGEKSICTVMREYSEGDLGSFFKKNTQIEKRIPLLLDVLTSLAGMHALKMCHLDLKTENILIAKKNTDYEIGLSDFETTKTLESPKFKKLLSSCPSPEKAKDYLLNRETEVSLALDLWVVGDLLYMVRYGSSLLTRHGLVASELVEEGELEDRELQATLDSDISDSDKLLVLEELKRVRGEKKEWFERKRLFSQKLETMQNYLETIFGKSQDTYDQCMLRLFSIDPSKRPSIQEVKEIVSIWWKKRQTTHSYFV